MQQNFVDGKLLAQNLKHKTKEELDRLVQRYQLKYPTIGYVQIGNNSESLKYKKNKEIVANQLGISFKNATLDQDVHQQEIAQKINELDKDPLVNGIFVTFPLPSQLIHGNVIQCISPIKDIDGLHPLNQGMLHQKHFQPFLIPATVSACIRILQNIFTEDEIDCNQDFPPIPQLKGKHAVIVGRSTIVGSPLVGVLTHYDATVTFCHRHTKDLQYFTKQADILFTATGIPKIIKSDMIKEGCIVIDIGIKQITNQNNQVIILGDVDQQAYNICGKVTPVPGGVGPLTVACLMNNVVKAWKMQNSSKFQKIQRLENLQFKEEQDEKDEGRDSVNQTHY